MMTSPNNINNYKIKIMNLMSNSCLKEYYTIQVIIYGNIRSERIEQSGVCGTVNPKVPISINGTGSNPATTHSFSAQPASKTGGQVSVGGIFLQCVPHYDKRS